MQEITNAHDILGDAEKKKIYDQHGEEGLKQHQANGGRQQNPFDIFSMFGFGGGGQNQEARTPDVTLPLHVTLKDLYLGRVTEVHYVRHVLCERHSDCTTTNGCGDCSGPGQRVVTRQLGPGFVQRMEQADPKCISQVRNCAVFSAFFTHHLCRVSVGRTTANIAKPSPVRKR